MTEYRLQNDSVFALIYCSCYLLVTHTFASHEFLNECYKCVCISVRVRVCVCVCVCARVPVLYRGKKLSISVPIIADISRISYRYRIVFEIAISTQL
jgi:hypothetical protein